MRYGMKGCRALAFSLAALTMGGLLAAPVTARADDPGKGKDGKKKGDDIPIVIGPPTIVRDPPPSPPPKKKDK